MHISPDTIILCDFGIFRLNATIVYTWIVMGMLTLGSWLITRRLSTSAKISRWQNMLEAVISIIQQQIREIMKKEPGKFLPFIGTLFLFIALSNLLSIVPGSQAPTGSLSTTAALACFVFIVVPGYGIAEIGVVNYVRNYFRPTFFMFPFNVMGEFSRTLALAVRLFGNVMSGTMIGAILLTVVPLIFPILFQCLGLLTGLVQAYIFAVLAAVYIAAGMEIQKTT